MLPYTQDTPGNVDWEGFILGLRDIGYRGTLSFETFRGLGMFPKEVHREVLQLIAALGCHFRKCILGEEA